MKSLILIVFVTLLSSKYSYSNSSLQTAEMGVCKELEASLVIQFIVSGKDLPMTWDEFEEIGLIKKNSLERQSFKIKSINSFSLVPNTPLIRDQLGISHQYSGLRLFLISRRGIATKSSGVGRCAILIGPNGAGSEALRTYSYFIPEETSKLILDQINGFDPLKQPLAFDDKFISENRNTIKGNWLEQLRPESPHPLGSDQIESKSDSNSITPKSSMFWFIGFFILFILLVVSLVYQARKNKYF
jgi:hypothetical protein